MSQLKQKNLQSKVITHQKRVGEETNLEKKNARVKGRREKTEAVKGNQGETNQMERR